MTTLLPKELLQSLAAEKDDIWLGWDPAGMVQEVLLLPPTPPPMEEDMEEDEEEVIMGTTSTYMKQVDSKSKHSIYFQVRLFDHLLGTYKRG